MKWENKQNIKAWELIKIKENKTLFVDLNLALHRAGLHFNLQISFFVIKLFWCHKLLGLLFRPANLLENIFHKLFFSEIANRIFWASNANFNGSSFKF